VKVLSMFEAIARTVMSAADYSFQGM